MRELKGQLLVASPKLSDPNFHRTVLLMIRHGDGGSMGIILNRPLEVTVKEACEGVLEIPCRVEGPLYQGGPCEGPLMVIHSDNFAGELELLPGAYLTTEKEKLERLFAEGGVGIKCFAGYAGWSDGQLANELEEGAWLVMPATARHIFAASRRQWSKLMTQLTAGDEIDPESIPDDPQLN